MMASRFTKAFQLIAFVLVFAVVQVYVIAAPIKANTDPKPTDKSSVTQPIAETVVADSATTAPNVASEKMPLTAGTKTMLARIFSKNNVEARLAAGNTFFNAKMSAGETFKAPRKALAAPQSDDDDDDGDESGKKGAWIAAGVVAVVLVIAVIGLRADRNRTDIGNTGDDH
jgi:hypothetical protein